MDRISVSIGSIAGYIKKKMNEKYTWTMLMREFGYTTAKKTLNNPREFFNNAVEVAKTIPADFWKATTDGTVASKVAGDGLSIVIESASKKGSFIVGSALFVSQSVNIYARSTASETAYKNPYPIVVSYAGGAQQIAGNNKPSTVSPTQSQQVSKSYSYDIRELQGVSPTTNRKMMCGKIRKLYLPANKKLAVDISECSTFVVRDNYYYEYLLPISFLKESKNERKVTVCSARDSFFIGLNNQQTNLENKKCQALRIRTRDSKYIYAGYVNPTCRLSGDKPVCYGTGY